MTGRMRNVLLNAPPVPHRGELAVPMLLVALAVLGLCLVLLDIRSPLRAALVALVVLVGPGFAVLDHWGLARGVVGACLVVATSASLTTVVLLVQLYAGVWSAQTSLVVLILFVIAVEVCELVRRFRLIGKEVQ
jgi:hypothetical protein